MKKFLRMIAVVLLALLLMPAMSTFTTATEVPVIYPGDTDETIARRAQWIQGAKRESGLIWWGSLNPNLADKLIAKFNKIYPFINVSYWRGRGEEIAPKLEAAYAGGRQAVDIMLGGVPNNYPRWRKMGIIAPFTDIIPNISKIPPALYSKFGDWFIAGNNAISPQYNTVLVSASDAPKSWDDLLDPKWKGQMGMTTDVKVWTTLALAEGGWGIEKTEDFLRKLSKQEIIWARGHSAGHTLLIAGEFKIFAEDYVYHTLKSQDKGAPVEWVRVSPIPITGSAFTLQKNAPNPNAARLFIEWQCSLQGMVAFEDITAKGPAFPGAGTRISKTLEGLDLCLRTEEVILKVNELGLEERFYKLLGIIN